MKDGDYPLAHWSEYSGAIIAALNLKKHSADEYHGACPNCGGTDRFRINKHNGEVKAFCRQCQDFSAITGALRDMGVWPQLQNGASERQRAPLSPFSDLSAAPLTESKPIAAPESAKTDPNAPYHIRKGVELNGAELNGSDVVVTITNGTGKRIGTQTIKPNGDKRFNKGLAKEGAFAVLNGPLVGECYIAEGWATAASVSQATGRPAVFALDAGNLPKVAEVLAEVRPDAKFIVAADNDAPGIKAAKEAGLPYVAPALAGQDWNDVFVALGADAVATRLRNPLKALSPLEKLKKRAFKASDLAGKPVPEREWHVPGLIPDATVTLLSGDGGTGKSLLALQLAMSTALGVQWLRNSVRQGQAFYLSAEDDDDELHRRINDIAQAYGADLSDLSGLTARSLISEETLLATLEPGGSLSPAPLFEAIEGMLDEMQPNLLVLDTLADYFPGNENDRAQARQFVGMLRGLAVERQCAIVMLSHPSLSGMGSGTGMSGSTAWNNSVRSRLYFTRVKDGEYEQDTDARVLKTMKANYGSIGGEIMMKWENGVFIADAPVAGLDRMAASAKAERVFLKLLNELNEQGRTVNHAGGPTYAPKVFASMKEAEGVTKGALKAAMDSLFNSGKIQLAESGPPSKRRQYLKVTK